VVVSFSVRKSHSINKQTYSGRHCDGFSSWITNTLFRIRPLWVIDSFQISRSSSDLFKERRNGSTTNKLLMTRRSVAAEYTSLSELGSGWASVAGEYLPTPTAHKCLSCNNFLLQHVVFSSSQHSSHDLSESSAFNVFIVILQNWLGINCLFTVLFARYPPPS
jgi:hypothetical protein